jgi:hypothetical protein
MLRLTNKPFMLSIEVQNAFMLSVIMLNVLTPIELLT